MTARPNTAEQIGKLIGQVQAMNDRLDRDRADLQERDREASKSREDVRRTLEELKDGHTELKTGQDALAARVTKMEPTIAKVNSWQSMVAGGMIVFGILGSMVYVFWEAVRDKMIAFFSGTA
jgi:chromosome segregation ATPase